MPPSYQAPSVESVVGEPLDSARDDHHTPPSTAIKEDFTLSKAHEAESLTTNNDTSHDAPPPDEAHVETDSTAMVLSSPPLIEDPHDEPPGPDRRVPRELRTDYGEVIRAPSPSVVSDISGLTSRSAGSSGSGSTVTRRGHAGRRGGERHRNGDRPHTDTIPEHHHGETTPRPLQAQWHEPAYSDAGRLQAAPPHFLEQQQHHQQTRGWALANPPGHRHSATRSISSAGSSSLGSNTFSTLGHATDGSLSSPDRSEPADSPESRFAYRDRDQQPYSGPSHASQHIDPFQFIEHPFPNGPGPHQQQLSAPPHLAPQLSPSFHEPFQHPPRPDNLPRTGYEQLASWLTVNETGAPAIQPMYRRFETLNHRLLLHLQDELMELEEELRRLDALDSQNRHAPGGFHPASCRQEAIGGGELYYRKTELFNMIGIKMEKYNQLLSSFGETQSLQSPDPVDIDTFRDYLNAHSPIVQAESQFLDAEEDLVSLSRAGATNDFNSENLLTPMPRRAITFPPTPTSPVSEAGSRVGQRQRGRPLPRKQEAKPLGALPLLAGGMAASFFLPIMAFVLIPAFVGRLAVVFLMSVVTGVALLQTGALRHLNGPGAGGGATDVVVCAGVYGAVMAVLAVLL